MIERIPALVAAICLTMYWCWVVVKVIRLRRTLHRDANAIPRDRVGRLMRIVWLPCVVAQINALWIAARWPPRSIRGETNLWRASIDWLWMPSRAWSIAAILATILCVVCTILTFVCWSTMDRSWRLGIDRSEKLDLISTGPYAYVRHPIYTLRMVMACCVFVMATTPLVLVTGAIDFVLLQLEARREEQYMESTNGAEYSRYKKSVGRFIPRRLGRSAVQATR